MEAFLKERYELAMERIEQIKDEHILPAIWDAYFVEEAAFLESVKEDGPQRGEVNMKNTDSTYMQTIFGEEYGPLLAAVAEEMRSMVAPAEEEYAEEMVIRPELFVELYGACVCEWQESGRMPGYETLKEIVYWYVSDYTDIIMERQFRERMASQEGSKTECIPKNGILQDENWLKNSFLWDKALAKRRREVAETLQEKYSKGSV